MKLSKIYSNDTRFKPVEFNFGFNLILGIVKEEKSDMHNLGKSTLVTLIDFMLLKEIDKNHIFNKKFELFKNHIFFLEILLNSGIYLTIKRKVEENTKISFKIHGAKEILVGNEEWDEIDLTIRKAKIYLNKQLNFNILTKYDYRKFLHYFLKNEKFFDPDFSKFEYGAHEKWKPGILDLIGLDSTFYSKKIKLEKDLKKITDIYPEDEDYSIQLREKEAKKRALEKRLELLENETNKLDYFKIDENITQEMIDNIVYEISNLNEVKYKIIYDITKLEESLNGAENTIDLEELSNLFEEVRLYFPDQLKKNYNDLIKFNNQIFKERKESILKTLKKKNEKLEEVNKKLLELNEKQKDFLETLKKKNIYDKVMKYQKDIIEMRNDIDYLTKEVVELRAKEEVIRNISSIKQEINENVEKLKVAPLAEGTVYDRIVSTLQEITQNIFDNRIGILNVKLNSAENPEFNLSFMNISTNLTTAEDQGGTYGEWLDACFNIATIVTYSDKSFYKFLYQDGILESGDNRRKHNFIVEIKRLCQKYKIQYITTGIEHELNSKEVVEVIGEEDIVLKLDDNLDGSGTLFGFSF